MQFKKFKIMSGSCILILKWHVINLFSNLTQLYITLLKQYSMTKLCSPQNCIYTKFDFIRIYRGRTLSWNSCIIFESRLTCANLNYCTLWDALLRTEIALVLHLISPHYKHWHKFYLLLFIILSKDTVAGFSIMRP